MDFNEYQRPVARLLTFGSVERNNEWPDYTQLGIGPEHIDELIRMATDLRLSRADSQSREVWAPLHAWRALGQLRAEAAARPLLQLFTEVDDDDWSREELPTVFGLIGPAAIPPVSEYLSDESHNVSVRLMAADTLLEIAKRSPESQDECASILGGELEKHAQNDPGLNGFLISNLVELQSRQKLELMEEAFSAGHVDEVLIDWHEVEVQFGLREPESPMRVIHLISDAPRDPHERTREKERRKKTKRQRKAAAKSRKLSRRRK